jgi:hypothetical protein
MGTDGRKLDKHQILLLTQEAESPASLVAHGIDLVRWMALNVRGRRPCLRAPGGIEHYYSVHTRLAARRLS